MHHNGHTSGIAHASKKGAVGPPVLATFNCNKRMRLEKCADVKDRVDLKKSGSDYCKMCYRKQGKVGTFNQKRKKCSKSRLGCPFCKEPVCDNCWKSGYDRHQN